MTMHNLRNRISTSAERYAINTTLDWLYTLYSYTRW